MPQRTLISDDICEGLVVSIREVIEVIKSQLNEDPNTFLSRTHLYDSKKDALRIDLDAEDTFRYSLRHERDGLLKNIRVAGEESINPDTDYSDFDGIVAIVDMIDGTDLMERNLSNWCSAAICFRPQNPDGKKIEAACVGVTSKRIYFAHSNSDRVCYKDQSHSTQRIGGTSKVTQLSEASISFYGQKVGSLLNVLHLPLFGELSKQDVKRTRIYTLAGIPMMMKLIDHQSPKAASIDVIFETTGQKPHDVAAGAYIAKRAGAYIHNLDTGTELTYQDLERSLMRPGDEKSELRYVMSSTRELADEIIPLLAACTSGATS